MNEFATLIDQAVEKRQRLNELKAQSPELAEAIETAEDYQRLLHDLQEQCKGQIPAMVPMPYPVLVPTVPPWQWIPDRGYPALYPPYKITCETKTTAYPLPELQQAGVDEVPISLILRLLLVAATVVASGVL